MNGRHTQTLDSRPLTPPSPPGVPAERRGARVAGRRKRARERGIRPLTLILALLQFLLIAPPAMCTEIAPPPDNPLLEAVKKGDAREVKSILALPEARDEINEKGNWGYTPLATAAKDGNLKIVRLLVEHGAAIDGAKGDEDRTPLMEAAAYGHAETAKYLISKGADVNARRKGLTPLLTACDHYSAHFGPAGDKKTAVSLLLKSGADVNVQDDSWLKTGMTPLMYAVAQQDPLLVRTMLMKRAKPDMQNKKGETALIMAAQGGDIEIVRLLLEKGSDVSLQDKQGKTAWTNAYENERPEVMKLLEKKGASKTYAGVTWEGKVSSQKEEFIKIVTTPEEWSGLWKGAFGKKAPDMDFEHYAVACVFLGHSAKWLYSITLGRPHVRDNLLVIPYGMVDIVLELSGPFKAGGQYLMKVYEKPKGLDMVIEDALDEYRKGT